MALIRGITQIRQRTISRALLDSELDALLLQITDNIMNIQNTMSTDQERIDAVNQLSTAYQNADGDLKATIQSLADQAAQSGLTKVLDANGNVSYTYSAKSDASYIAQATSIHNATVILDTELKYTNDALQAEIVARSNAVTNLQEQISSSVNTSLEAIQTNVGLDANNVFVPIVANYLTASENTVKKAISKLNDELFRVEGVLNNQRVIKFEDMIFNETPTGAIDSVNKSFITIGKVRSGSLQVTLNGQQLFADEDFTINPDQRTFTLSADVPAPISPDKIKVAYIKDNA